MCQIPQLIEKYQQGDKECLLHLINQFQPLLKCAAYKANYEDAFSDIQLFFIELISNLKLSSLKSNCDAALVNYFKQAIKNYVFVLRKNAYNDKAQIRFEDLNEYEKLQIEVINSTCDSYDNLLLSDIKNVLTEREFFVVSRFYFHDFSIVEIANEMKISRQAVNDIKQKAFKKLRKFQK